MFRKDILIICRRGLIGQDDLIVLLTSRNAAPGSFLSSTLKATAGKIAITICKNKTFSSADRELLSQRLAEIRNFQLIKVVLILILCCVYQLL